MTYCVGLYLADGIVLLSDTRTNAGVDNISSFRKMHVFEQPGARAIVALTSGNLAVTQAVINLIQEGSRNEDSGEVETIYTVPSMFRAAQLVGSTVRSVYKNYGESMEAQGIKFDVSIILAGQLQDRTLRLFQIYAAGNFIAATSDTPYFQIGETKYGKPILDRALTYDTSLADGTKLALISMDSTLRSNLSVGLPMDYAVIRKGTCTVSAQRRITEHDPYFDMIRERWSTALRDAYRAIPTADWAG